MSTPAGRPEGVTRAQMAADAVHRCLRSLLRSTSQDPQSSYHVGVIGYGARVGSLWCHNLAARDLIAISELADARLRVEPQPDGVILPVWFEPGADGPTPMVRGLDRAREAVAGWVGTYPHGQPPVVLNISDGASTDGDPRTAAARLRGLATTAGNVQLFNIHLGDNEALWYGLDAASTNDAAAAALFDISSALPTGVQQPANVAPVAGVNEPRGFVFNAGSDELDSFLNIGMAMEARA